MHAIGYRTPGALDREESLQDITLERPVPSGRDLLVEIRAVSVNPVDTKVRRTVAPASGDWTVLGWDAAGIVVGTGPEVRRFAAGDAVFYAGALDRTGANAEFHLVDERIVGTKPASLDFAEAAALPLTAITAWEALFDRLDVGRPVPGAARALLIVGGAGGVGSIAIQLARQLTGLTVIATASRRETREWALSLGAHHVIDHSRALPDQIAALGLDGAPAFVFSTNHSDTHLAGIAEAIAPQGRLAVIDDPGTLAVSLLKRKSVSLHWEFMFTRSMFQTADIEAQGALLSEVARLVDAGTLRTTLTERRSPIDAATLKQAHRAIEAGSVRGKIVLEGFGDVPGR